MVSGKGALDRFRILAALMIVAIHTAVFDPTGRPLTYLAVYVGARIAVPFFFMITGFFVLPRILCEGGVGRKQLAGFIRKMLVFYAGVSLLYLPLAIYAGYYEEGGLIGQILRNLIFDGTFYHLWYLPASIIGVLILWLAFRFWGARGAGVLSAALYGIGLLGDSYYGLAAKHLSVQHLYEGMFSFFSYTRNGIFYAPIFLWMGWRVARRAAVEVRQKSPVPFLIFFVLMLGEGYLLAQLGWMRHTSMYLLLPVCMYFLFDWLQARGGAAKPFLRSMAGWIYVVHPLFIVLLRAAARFLGMQALLVENDLVHYVCVCLLSAAFAAGAAGYSTRGKREADACRAWAEIDRSSLLHNIACLKAQLPDSCRLMPALKANAYGHGALAVAGILRQAGIADCCVATAQEGAALRRAGMRGEILVLGYTPWEALPLVRRYRLTQTAADCADAARLHEYGHKIRVHLKVDTGMHRLGERSENLEGILAAFALPGIRITGLYSHIGADYTGEAADSAQITAQVELFEQVCAAVREAGYQVKIHLQSSYGIMCMPLSGYDYARPGIALYGMLGNAADTRRYAPALRPALQVKCRVACVKPLKKGESAGYGTQFSAPEDMRVAVLGIGYADGIPRSLSNGQGSILIHGMRCPVIGRICMDQMLVDVSAVKEVHAGDTAVLIGQDGEEAITACEIAEICGTITNEVLSRLGERLARKVTG